MGKPSPTHDISFDDFVLAYLKSNKPSFANVGSQATFLTPRPGARKPDHLFRYEEPARLNQFLETRLGLTLTLGRENASPEMDTPLSPEVETRLSRKCTAEFDLHNSIP